MNRWRLIIGAVLLLAVPVIGQEATETPAPEATAEATPAAYAWCGYLLLEGVAVDEDALALLASLFPADGAPDEQMQWRPRPDGAGGILEGCHRLPVERWRIVSLLQQGTGMEYAQMDNSLLLITFASVDDVRTWLTSHAAEWDEPDEPMAEATPAL